MAAIFLYSFICQATSFCVPSQLATTYRQQLLQVATYLCSIKELTCFFPCCCQNVFCLNVDRMSVGAKVKTRRTQIKPNLNFEALNISVHCWLFLTIDCWLRKKLTKYCNMYLHNTSGQKLMRTDTEKVSLKMHKRLDSKKKLSKIIQTNVKINKNYQWMEKTNNCM